MTLGTLIPHMAVLANAPPAALLAIEARPIVLAIMTW